MTQTRRTFLAVAVAIGCGVALLGLSSFSSQPDSRPAVAAQPDAAQPGAERWYRGNLHTHTLWSDGDDYLEMVGLWYRDHGYDFLAFTDHNALADRERWIDVEKNKGGRVAFDRLKARFPTGWVDERMTAGRLEVRLKTFAEVQARVAEPGRYLLIQGQEVTDSFQKFPVHMNATNVKELVTPRKGGSVREVMQNNTDALISQRERTGQPMLIHLNHPNFGFAVTAEELMRVRGENFFEVYNGHPTVNNSGSIMPDRASTDRIWDIINTFRIADLKMPLMYGLATDDGHDYLGRASASRRAEPGRGWVMVQAPELSPGALITAMEQGRFYASSGVTLKQITATSEELQVEIEPQKGVRFTVEFIGTRKDFDRVSSPVTDRDGKELRTTREYSSTIGAVLERSDRRNASYRFKGDELYVRALITSSRKHPNPSESGEFERAWTQPVLGPAAPKD